MWISVSALLLTALAQAPPSGPPPPAHDPMLGHWELVDRIDLGGREVVPDFYPAVALQLTDGSFAIWGGRGGQLRHYAAAGDLLDWRNGPEPAEQWTRVETRADLLGQTWQAIWVSPRFPGTPWEPERESTRYFDYRSPARRASDAGPGFIDLPGLVAEARVGGDWVAERKRVWAMDSTLERIRVVRLPSGEEFVANRYITDLDLSTDGTLAVLVRRSMPSLCLTPRENDNRDDLVVFVSRDGIVEGSVVLPWGSGSMCMGLEHARDRLIVSTSEAGTMEVALDGSDARRIVIEGMNEQDALDASRVRVENCFLSDDGLILRVLDSPHRCLWVLRRQFAREEGR